MTFYSWTPYRHQAPLNYRGVCPAEGAGNPAPALDPRWLPTEAPLLPLPSVLCGRPNPPALRHFRLSRCHGAGLLNGSRGAEPPDGGRPLGARLVGSGDNGGCGARGPVVAPDGSGRPRRERAGLKRRRRRPGAGRRSGREAEGGPPAGRARGRLRGAGAGARAGSRGGYDDPATGPRISSPPPPPHGSPSSRLRTRPTGGESDRAGRRLGPGGKAPRRGASSHPLPEAGPGGPRALRGARPAGGASLGAPPPGTRRPVLRPGRSRPRRSLRSRESGEAPGLFSGQLPLPPATSFRGVLLSSDDRGPPCASSPGRFFPRPSWQVPSVWLVRVYFTALLITMVLGYLCSLRPGSGVWKGRRWWGGCGSFSVLSASVL